jgi:hypothetical protein
MQPSPSSGPPALSSPSPSSSLHCDVVLVVVVVFGVVVVPPPPEACGFTLMIAPDGDITYQSPPFRFNA